MSVPFFYIDTVPSNNNHIVLNEETSRHIVQVLRMQLGEPIRLTDGLGNLFMADITDAHKKKCTVILKGTESVPQSRLRTCIAISPLKNTNRFEWFLEKAAEMGVTDIIPVMCTRTEKTHIRTERLNGILVSAMLQSQQAWLTRLHEPAKFPDVLNEESFAHKLIAHCDDAMARVHLAQKTPPGDCIMLIGPEGDFTSEEIVLAVQKGFEPVSLGNNRLRTETAGVAAAVLLTMRG